MSLRYRETIQDSVAGVGKLMSTSTGRFNAVVRGAAASLILLAVTGCSVLQRAVPGRDAPSGLIQPKSFSDAVGRHLTDIEVDSYIDIGVVGHDRQLALSLMKQMPPEKRGDFIDYGTAGRVISNRVDLRDAALRALPIGRPQRISDGVNKTASRTARSSPRLKSDSSDYTNACSPPNPGSHPSGPYIRFLSKCSFTGAIGYVSVACGSSSFGINEGGSLYFELRGKAGSLTEAGLQYNDDYSVQPYHRSTNSGYDTG